MNLNRSLCTKWFDKIFCGYENEKINFDVPHLDWQVIHIFIQPFPPSSRGSHITRASVFLSDPCQQGLIDHIMFLLKICTWLLRLEPRAKTEHTIGSGF